MSNDIIYYYYFCKITILLNIWFKNLINPRVKIVDWWINFHSKKKLMKKIDFVNLVRQISMYIYSDILYIQVTCVQDTITSSVIVDEIWSEVPVVGVLGMVAAKGYKYLQSHTDPAHALNHLSWGFALHIVSTKQRQFRIRVRHKKHFEATVRCSSVQTLSHLSTVLNHYAN